ncbi:MAG: hypothetical protein GYB67_03955, partial [Chloroflexi bacterium]|nr:hypothetical protein [Chloroflexota bacterium]
ESNQPISGRTSIIAHPASVYVGLLTDSYFADVGDPLDVELITVTPDSVPVPNQSVDLEIIERRWTRTPTDQFGRFEWTRETIPVGTDTIRTDGEGRATYAFTPPNGGSFRIRAVVRDDQERLNRADLRVYAFGNERVFWNRTGGDGVNNIVVDQDSYAPGDTARVLIPLPYEEPSTVLITVARADILTHEVIQTEGTSLVYDLPITEAFVPTVHLQVSVYRGLDPVTLNPAYASGWRSINVEPVNQRLNVAVTPSSLSNEPRSEVSFDFVVTDADGNPAQAELGVALTDEAVLALAQPNSTTLEAMFYGYQRDYTLTNYSMLGLLDLLTDGFFPGGRGGGGGGGGGGGALLIRDDFVYTPLWAPDVVTDENGRASVSVTLPDNLTTWRLDTRAVTTETHIGQREAQIVSTLPLIVRPVAPRFFVVGDRVALGAVVNNNSDTDQTVAVSLEATGVTLESPVEQTVTIPAGSRARVDWLAVVEDVPNADLVFIAIGDDYQDAARPALTTGPNNTIPVYAYTAPDTVGTGGLLREGGAITEAISLPPRLAVAEGELTVRLDPSIAATTVESLDYLRNFPHQCIEQTVSRFLPNVITFRALDDLGLADQALRDDLMTVLNEGLAGLRAQQNPDGGWGWFAGMDSNALVTAYAVLGLTEARAAGFDIADSLFDPALAYVRSQFMAVTQATPNWQLNRMALFAYVLANADEVSASQLQALLDQRLRMSQSAQAFLLLAANETRMDSTFTAPLISDLTTNVILSANGAHWEEARPDWRFWDSDTRTTALVLSALVRYDADNPLLPNVVRWLMIARQGDAWTTTQETAWAVMGLTDWMVVTGELNGNYDLETRLNDVTVTERTVTPQTIREGEVLRVAVGDLLTDRANRLTVARGDGAGALYYSAYMDLRLPADQVTALSRGVTVNREYFLGANGDTPITEAEIGDLITVRLTLTLPQDLHYFVLEDPLPAG